MKNQKNITDRKQLKTFFKKGSLPDESAFERLIDSTFNKKDDRLDINEDGLMIYPSENGEDKLLSFFEDKDNDDPTWALFISKKDAGGISFNKIDQSTKTDPPTLFLKKANEYVGIGTDSPSQKLEVNGLISSRGRVGNYLEAEMDADGEWHNVFNAKALQGCNAYEIMAYAEGDPLDGKYSLMHAIAICTYGNSKPKITKTCAHHGKWWNKIDIRWESRPSKIASKPASGKKKIIDISRWWKNVLSLLEPKDTLNYNLQLKTKSNYGDGKKIVYKVSVLWNDDFMGTSN